MSVKTLRCNDDAIGGCMEGIIVCVGKVFIGQTGIVGLIGSWLGA